MLHLNGFYGYRPKWELNFGPVYMDCCVDRKMSICWSECNQLATKALLVFCSLTKNNNDIFISFGQGGTSIIFVVNNTSRPIWTLYRLSVKAQVEPYLHRVTEMLHSNKQKQRCSVSLWSGGTVFHLSWEGRVMKREGWDCKFDYASRWQASKSTEQSGSHLWQNKSYLLTS